MPHAEINVPGLILTAGFQLTLIGRFWVTPLEVEKVRKMALLNYARNANNLIQVVILRLRRKT